MGPDWLLHGHKIIIRSATYKFGKDIQSQRELYYYYPAAHLALVWRTLGEGWHGFPLPSRALAVLLSLNLIMRHKQAISYIHQDTVLLLQGLSSY